MYRYLSVTKSARELVTFPDGTTTTVDLGEGASASATWITENGERVTPDTAQAERQQELYNEALGEWQAELDRRQDLVGLRSITALREVRENFEAELPKPLPPGGEGAQDAPQPIPTVDRVPWWIASGPGPDDRWPLAPGSQPVPRAEIAERLSALEAKGWSVVHVADERIVEHDEDWARSTVVGSSFLLRRAEQP